MIAKRIAKVIAVICGIALPIWILGVPGIENEYARGWRISLITIMTFIFSYFMISGINRRYEDDSEESENCQNKFDRIYFALIILFVIAMYNSFLIMLN